MMRDRLLAKPNVELDKCIGCGLCAKMCPPQSLKIVHGKPLFKLDECIRCCCCQEHCPKGAIEFKTNFLLRGVELLRTLLSKLAR